MPRTGNSGPAARCGARWAWAVCAAAGLAASAAAPAQVQWRSGGDGAVPAMTGAEVFDALAAAGVRATDSGAQRLVVQFDRPVSDARRAALAASGMTLLSYLGDNAYFASIGGAGAVRAEAIASDPTILSVREIERRWKLDPFLESGLTPTWAVVDAGERGKDGAMDPVIAVYAMLHKDVALAGEGAAIAARRSAFVRSEIPPVNGLVLELPQSQVQALAEEPGVMWVEPALPQWTTTNSSNRARTGADIVNSAPYDLSGAGVSVMVFDGGTSRTTHVDFQGRATNRDTDAISDHATHVSGTIGGAGIANPLHRGMAPGVTIQNYGFEWDSGNGFLYTDPGDLWEDYSDAILNHGATISNNSIGNNTSPNGFPCDRLGNYGFTDTLIDEIARGAIGGESFRIVWAAGNERQTSACDGGNGGYFKLAPPANAKNQMGIGALNSNDDSMTSFSSWGPSDDGRMKPDFCAPGSQNGSHVDTNDNGVTSCSSSSSNTGYSVKSGTSMASPTVCGLAALLIEDWRNQHSGEPDPMQALLKVFFAHTAVDIFPAGPDYRTGYGSVRIEPAINLMRSGNFITGVVTQGAQASFLVVVNPGEEFRATLSWDDPSGTPNVVPALVNDLDLVVTDPNGVRRHVWTLDPALPSIGASRTQANSRDNLEQVLVEAGQAAPGVWRVDVAGTNVAQGPQTFALTATPQLINCSTAGVASLGQTAFACDDTMLTASVTDCDLNTDNKVVESITVVVASTSEPGGEMVTLTESGAETADFRGSILLAETDAPGVLHFAPGDTISFTYIDADDGDGGTNVPVTASATVDCTAPLVSDVQVTNIGPFSAIVSFQTDEIATASVSFGASCGGEMTVVNASGSGTSHMVALSGLAEDTEYFFTVSATDLVGNGDESDNGGSCYAFETEDIPNYFTEMFAGSEAHDLDFRTTTLTPNGLIDFYRACVEEASEYPVDPAGGNVITFPSTQDDQFVQVNIGGGESVSLYGVEHTSFFVGTNGYITFTAGDQDYSETLADHFDLPRISGVFDDLHPGQGGQVSWKQTAEGVAVTWNGVREYNTTDTNSFQIWMGFDGVIRVTWLACGSDDCIVGVSAGEGQPLGFFEADYTGFGSCAAGCPGDFNGDGTVGFGDLNLLLNNYGSNGAGLVGDMDGDMDVDFADLNMLLDLYGSNC